MIQLSRQDQTICVEAAEEESLDRALEPGSDKWRQQVTGLIREMYCRGGFKGQEVVSCLPGDMLKIKSLRLGGDFSEDIEEVMRTEVAKRFGLDPDHDEIRYMVAGDAYQGSEIKNEVIFFGIEQDQLKRHIGLIEQSGLVPISLDTVPSALFRCFKTTLRRREDQELVSVFVDLGSQFTTVIIGRGQEISFVKQIPIAGDELNEQVSTRLGIPMAEAIERGADLVVGTRARSQSELLVHQPWYREGMGRAFNLLVRLLGLTLMPDTQCGFKGFPSEVLPELLAGLRTDGFAFDVEMLAAAERDGLRIAEQPVRWTNDPSSHVSIFRDSWRMIVELLAIAIRMRRRAASAATRDRRKGQPEG